MASIHALYDENLFYKKTSLFLLIKSLNSFKKFPHLVSHMLAIKLLQKNNKVFMERATSEDLSHIF